MLISIVFITIRPGVYDMLFNSLVGQTYSNYELIIVDDACEYRRQKVLDYAKLKQINIAYYGPSKTKTYPENKFCYANAMNTGLKYVNGDITLFVQDFCWLPPILLETINELYTTNHTLTLLSFQEILYKTPIPKVVGLSRKEAVERCPLYIFDEEMTLAPPMQNYKLHQGKNPKLPNVDGMQIVPLQFWECFCSAINTSLIKALNGFNEILDKGDDCNEKDIMIRAKMLGVGSYVCPLPVWQLYHHLWENSGDWKRFSEHTNLGRFGEYINSIKTVEQLVPQNNEKLFKDLIVPRTTKVALIDDIKIASTDLEADIAHYTAQTAMLTRFKQDIWRARHLIDIGAHIGFFSVFAAKTNPALSVRAFDASPFSNHIIEENIVLNFVPNMTANCALVWDGGEPTMLTLPTRITTHYDTVVCVNGVPNFYQKNKNITLDSIGNTESVILINISDCGTILRNATQTLKDKPILYILNSSNITSIAQYLQTYGYTSAEVLNDYVRIS
jgi:FkbM family methyltransferase